MAAADFLGIFPSALGNKSATSGLFQGLSLNSNSTSKTILRTFRPFRSSRRRVAVKAASDTNNQPTLPARDPFKAATLRLQNLLSGVGEGEQEFVDSILVEEAADVKVLLAIVSGAIVSTAALTICWITRTDLLGGASFSLESLQAGAIGAALAIPLMVLKAVMWSAPAQKVFPILDDVYKVETGRMGPLIVNMSPLQVGVTTLAEVLSSLLLLLPAAQGALTVSLQYYFKRLQDMGYTVPNEVAPTLAVIAIALLCGLGRMVDHAPTEEEFEIVGNAVSNADRFYKLVSTSMVQRPGEADRMAAAFKVTAAAWFTRRTVAGSVSAMLAFCELLFLGVLWHTTQDLTAPGVAALLLHGTDFCSIHQSPNESAGS